MTRTTSGGRTTAAMKTNRTTTTAAAVAVTVLVLVVICKAATGVSAITTKSSAATAIKTTLQIFPDEAVDSKTTTAATSDPKPLFAARYWQQHQQRDIETDEFVQQPSHRLSAAQQAHILDDIRRHNQQQQWWTSGSTVVPQSTDKAFVEDDGLRQHDPEADQLQQLIQINGVAASDDTLTDSQDDDRPGKQRSIGWQPQPQPSQLYNRQQHQPSLSPYIPPPPSVAMTTISQPQNQHHYYPTMTSTSTSPAVQHHHVHHHQQQQLFVTTPSSPSSSSSSFSSSIPTASNSKYQQQFISLSQPQQHQPQYHSQLPAAAPSPSTVGNDDRGVSVGDLDPDIEQQIRQQLTAVAGANGGNYTILTSGGTPIGSIGGGGVNLKSSQHVSGSASTDNVQFVQIGDGGDGSDSGTSFSRNRLQQQLETNLPSIFSGAAGGNKNTIVKTVVVRQKSPSPQPAAATTTSAPVVARPAAPSTSAVAGPQHVWTASEREQLEQLARQVLPPGVAHYEIIRAGGVDGASSGDTATAATAPVADGAPPQSLTAAGGAKNKKPVTFVILEERPDGTVRVRGVEKKNQNGGSSSSNAAADGAGTDTVSAAAADDEQLQQLVDRLNKGELKLPAAGTGAPSKISGVADSAAVASSAASVSPSSPITTQSFATTAPPSSHKYREQPLPAYFPAMTTPRTTTVALKPQHHHQQQQQQQNIFLPTAVPTATPTVTTTVGQPYQHRYQQQQQQQQYYSTPAVASSAQPPVVNSTSSYFNNINKSAKEGVFSGALRRRGYYAMAKYMRQAGIDTVLEDTGPFTVFVPTDKAFRSLLVQLGGPDRAEEKFRENPRLLIGLLLHHVVPGAFKAADLMAGDEMTGVSLAGTQLRANLYARQLYDNRWNDIEVLTVNGARVLDDVVPASSALADDSSSTDESSSGPVQQRRDMILSSSSRGLMGGENQQIMAIGHAVDRVLFPLPVGDLLTTMRADRQRRYSVFLRAVDEHCSPSVQALLTGSRTLTVFAPVDEAFRIRLGSGNFTNGGGNSGSIVDWLLRDDPNKRFKKRNWRRIADRFVLSHVVLAGPGDPPMYTAGLRFYQVRDTAYRIPEGGIIEDPAGAVDGNDGVTDDDNGRGDDEQLTLPQVVDGEKPRYYQLTIYKDSGKIRLNGGAAQVLVRNVPATNGVLHGLDAPLV